MKITVTKDELKSSLDTTSTTLSTLADITSHFVFAVRKGVLTVKTACPPSVFSMVPVVGATMEMAEGAEQWDEFSIEGKRLLKALSAHKDNEVLTLSYDASSKKTTLTSSLGGKNVFESLDPNNFPVWETYMESIEEDSEGTPKVLKAELLEEAITVTKEFFSKDPARLPLTIFEIVAGRIVATDGHSLILAKHPDFEGKNLKVMNKDLANVHKFVKSYVGHDFTIKASPQAQFLIADEGSVLGIMNVPHSGVALSNPAFENLLDWKPYRAWLFKKEDLTSAIKWLSSGAQDKDYRLVFNVNTDPVTLYMSSRSGKEDLSQTLAEAPVPELEDGEELPFNLSMKGQIEEGLEEASISIFPLNYACIERAIDNLKGSDVFCLGVWVDSSSGKTSGGLIIKEETSQGIKTSMISSWFK